MTGAISELGVLGPLLVRVDGDPIAVTSRMHRGVLAMLVLSANHVMSVDALVDGLWGDDPPATALGALQVHVGKVRRLLSATGAPAPIVTRSPGYVLEVDPSVVDVCRFDDDVRRGRDHLAADRPAEASALLGRALAVWRGPALADVADLPFAGPAALRLDEARLGALGDRIDADLERGEHHAIVGELRELTATHPLRERLWEQLIVALYRSHNQAAALEAYHTAQRILLEELGLEPSAPLRALEQAILVQAPELDRRRPSGSRTAGLSSTIHDDRITRTAGYVEHDGVRHVLRGRLTIGRDPACDVTIDDGRVSRRHAELRVTADGVTIRDEGSTNGTLVNGDRVDHAALCDQDEVVVGACTLTVHLTGDGAPPA